MQSLARKESNKLLAAMPSAAVILDDKLGIIDYNKRNITLGRIILWNWIYGVTWSEESLPY